MKKLAAIAIACAAALFANAAGPSVTQQKIANSKIDPEAHRVAVLAALQLREKRRVTEQQFIVLAAQPGTVVLDARSESMFKLRHIKGAVNLPFTEFTEANLARVIPTPDTRVLIYCNNNFEGDQIAFADKRRPAALNLSTFPNLVIYGYNNVYELGPVLEVRETRIPFEGTSTAQR